MLEGSGGVEEFRGLRHWLGGLPSAQNFLEILYSDLCLLRTNIAIPDLGSVTCLSSMPTTQTPHRTPLRRVSQGSLFALSRSGAFPDAPHGLGFLEPAMSEFVDETEALQANVEGMKNLSDSLATFNESFASWLYIMNMNALTTDWPQVWC